jgi:hypothetical protein
VSRRIPPEFRRGWAEKRIRSPRKTLAQTEATSRMRPTWAITAVPVERLVDAHRWLRGQD